MPADRLSPNARDSPPFHERVVAMRIGATEPLVEFPHSVDVSPGSPNAPTLANCGFGPIGSPLVSRRIGS